MGRRGLGALVWVYRWANCSDRGERPPSRVDSDDVKRKRSATELWCKKRGMGYIVYTIE